MKSCRVVALFVIFAAVACGQSDLSMWAKSGGGTMSGIPWFTHFGDSVVTNLRYNLDAERTAGLCFGHLMGSQEFSLVPEVCGYIGKTMGYGPEALVLGEIGRWSAFTQTQYFRGTNPVDSYVYHYGEALYFWNSRLKWGPAWQGFKPIGQNSTTSLDIGPAVKILLGENLYLKGVVYWGIDPNNFARRGNNTSYVAVGYGW